MLKYFLHILCCLCLVCSCRSQGNHTPTLPPADVTDYVIEPKTIPVVYDFIGFAESSHSVEIRARVEGYLDKIAYVEGQLVHENDLLFQLDPKQYEAKVEQSKGEVARQVAILENAKLTVNRLTPLFQQKAASKKDLDNATANELSAQASLQSATAQLLESEINLGYTTIRSPITGYADRSRLREGALINPGSNSLLTTVSVLDPIWIYFSISDNDILQTRKQEAEKQLKLPQQADTITLSTENNYDVEAILSDGSVYAFPGKVDFSAPTYDQSTGTLMVRAVFPNPEGNLRPGQFARVKVFGAKRPDAIFVPRRALMQKKNGMFVYLIGKDNKVISQDVSTGDWYGDYQIITNGLKAGDRIIVDGINKVGPGFTVRVAGPWKPDGIKVP